MKKEGDKRFRKGQSAMEYLMTYGWAILVIAIVLAALFELGVFSSANGLPTQCIGQSPYECTSVLLHSGTLSVTVGQASGTAWTAANFLFANSILLTVLTGASPGNAFLSTTANSVQVAGALASGSTYAYSSNLNSQEGVATAVGTTISGQMWVQYYTGSGGPYYAEVGILTAKAT